MTASSRHHGIVHFTFRRPCYSACMSFRRKLIVFWLLFIALPLQGFAAISMDCVHAHIHGASAPVQALSVHAMAHDGEQNAMSGSAHVGHPAAPDQQHHGASPQKASCVACYACCFGAALPPAAFANVLPEALPSRAAHFTAQETAGFLTGGIERPPKTSLV